MDYTTTYPLACGKYSIVDLDADEYGNFIALLNNGQVWTAAWQIHLAQQFNYPLIRALDEHRFVIVEARRGAPDNGFIFTNAGQQVGQFNAGDGIEDVLVQAGQLVISYFDEGVIGGQPPSSEGLALFDLNGQQLFGFNSSKIPYILDCYCMCKQGSNSLLACTYTDFPLLELHLNTHQLTASPTPLTVHGAQALSSFREWLIFYLSDSYQSGFFYWNKKELIRRAPFSKAHLRGIGNGKFLSYDATSFTIVDAMVLLQQYNPSAWYLN